MTTRSHPATIERAEMNLETGEFPMILASDGEASDGDILSIEGGQWPDKVPLQNAHMNEAKSTLGSITGFRRDLASTPKKLRARGKIEMGGEGAIADIRRDIAFMVSRDHIRGVSVRWQPVEWVRRVNLPSDHAAYVDAETEKDWRKRYGLFFKKWRVLEGSIAPVQADRESIIGRADETAGDVATFWRRVADDCIDLIDKAPEMPDPAKFEDVLDFFRAAMPIAVGETDSVAEAEQRCERAWAERDRAPEDEERSDEPEVANRESEGNGSDPAPTSDPDPTEPERPSAEALAAAAGAQLRELLATGIEREALLKIARDTLMPEPTAEERIAALTEDLRAVRSELAELGELREQARVHAEPGPALRTVKDITDHLDSLLEQHSERALAATRGLIERRIGRRPEPSDGLAAAHAEAEALIEKHLGPRPKSEAISPEDRAAMVERLESMIQTARSAKRAGVERNPDG